MSFSISNHIFQKRFIQQAPADNSCVASAVAHSIAVLMNRLHYNSFFPSILFLYYNGREEKEKDTGVYIEELLLAVQEYGIIPEELFPYTASNLLKKPNEELYDLAKEFPIHFTFEKFEVEDDMLSFIEEQLWNGNIILADIKQDINVDHTIAIYGIDEENKIFLCMDPTDTISSISFDSIEKLDRKDLYAINCKFPNKIPNFILQNEDIVKNNNIISHPNMEFDVLELNEPNFTFDRVIVGDNLAASFSTYFLSKTKEKQRVLFLVNNSSKLLKTNKDICNVEYGSYESLDESTLKFLYEMEQDFEIFPIERDELEEKIAQSLLNDVLKPLGLNTQSKDLNYQIVYCKKNDQVKQSSFEEILLENARNNDFLKFYNEFLEKNFPGLDLSLPFYVVLKIILPVISSKSKLYVKEYQLFLQKFLPNHKKIGLGTFLLNEIDDDFVHLDASYKIDENKNLLVFRGSPSEYCYSDKIQIFYQELYDANPMNIQMDITGLSFQPISKINLYFICSHERESSIEDGITTLDNIFKISIYETEAERILKEKPNNIYTKIIYSIDNYSELSKFCPDDSATHFLIDVVDFFYPTTDFKSNIMIKKAFGFDNTLHFVNTNFLGPPENVEYNLKIQLIRFL